MTNSVKCGSIIIYSEPRFEKLGVGEGNMGKAEKREKDILALLRVSGSVSVSEAMSLLDVSESTVRRLFAKLEAAIKKIFDLIADIFNAINQNKDGEETA